MSGPIPNPRTILYVSDPKKIRRLQRQGPEARDDLPAPMYPASPIRRPPSVDGAVRVDIGPPIASLFRAGHRMTGDMYQAPLWKAEGQQTQEDGTSASLQAVALNFHLQEEQAHTDQVMVIKADQQVVRVIGNVAAKWYDEDE